MTHFFFFFFFELKLKVPSPLFCSLALFGLVCLGGGGG